MEIKQGPANRHRKKYKTNKPVNFLQCKTASCPVIVPGGYNPFYHPGGCKVKADKPQTPVIWEAPTREDKRINSEIEKAQIDYGVGSQEAGKLIFDHAKNYYHQKQYLKAKNLLDKLTRLNRMFKGIKGINIAEVYSLRSKVNYAMRHYAKQYPIASTPARTPSSIRIKCKKDNLKTKKLKLVSKSLSPKTGTHTHFLNVLSDNLDQN